LKKWNGSNRTITVDETDFKIQEQRDQPRSWYSHKFHGPGVRYEVGVGITSGDIVWIHGPKRAGRYPDITIFRMRLKKKLKQHGEMAVADNGYRGEPETIDLPADGPVVHCIMKDRYRGRQENVNKRFKNFGCLKQVFRHSVDFHRDCFEAVAVLVQMSFDNGQPMWDPTVAI